MTDFRKLITKEVFERAVPAARMPDRQDSVFNRIGGAFEESAGRLLEIAGTEQLCDYLVEKAQYTVLTWVCLDAFISQSRSLDLVLTSTGFGIVSTGSVAPASAARVNSMIAELRTQRLLARRMLVCKLRTAGMGWEQTAAAAREIETLFWDPQDIGMTNLQLSEENWQLCRQRAVTSDAVTRNLVSSELTDALLERERAGTTRAEDMRLIGLLKKFTAQFISEYDEKKGAVNRLLASQIVETVESNPERFPEYLSSRLYGKRHAKRYENRQEDPTFFLFT